MALERQVRAKILGKRDPEQEREAQEWMESILGQKFPAVPYEDALCDGVVLCEVMNKLKPGSIPKINRGGGQFKMMENANNFIKAIEAYGVPKIDLFQSIDLCEKKDIGQVTGCIFALGRTTYRHPEYQGPSLGPRPAEENKREFSDEVIQAGKTVIGLQAGSNQGASQAGQNMGAGRKIILGK
ncbi:unnamed protein product [Orchesella dallaii]|uniref:Calponin n=1 Tax=Orchesella dallaii TaxID=48710 RepID=A0ABP1QVJ0_9HEXA